MLACELPEGGTVTADRHFEPDIAAPFDGAEDERLVPLVALPLPVRIPAEIGFVHFDSPVQLLVVGNQGACRSRALPLRALRTQVGVLIGLWLSSSGRMAAGGPREDVFSVLFGNLTP